MTIIKSQSVPVEPYAVTWLSKSGRPEDAEIADYIDSLLSAIQVAQWDEHPYPHDENCKLCSALAKLEKP